MEAAVAALAASTAHGLPLPWAAPCGSSTERFVISGGRISGELSSGSVSPNGATQERRIRPGFELDQFRPFLGPQRLRLVRAIRWLYRTLDRFQTVEKQRLFRDVWPAPNHEPAASAPIIPQLLRNCGSLRPKSLTRLGASSVVCVALRCRGYRMSNRSVKFVPALFAGVVAGANLATMTDLRAQVLTAAEAATQATLAAADSCLSAPKGATPAGSHWYYRIDRVTKTSMLVSPGGERQGRRQVRARCAAGFSAGAQRCGSRGAGAAAGNATITRKSISDARAEWISQQTPGRAKIRPPESSRERSRQPPPRSCQNSPRAAMPNVLAPAPLSSMRWIDAARHDALHPILADLPDRRRQPLRQRPSCSAGRGSAAARGRSGCAASQSDAGARQSRPRHCRSCLLVIAASPRAGRPHGKRDRQDRPHAGPPRHAPQAPRDVGCRKDAKTARRSAPPMFHDEDAGLRRTAGAYNPRVPQDRTRMPQERTRAPQEQRTRAPQERVRAPQGGHVPQERPRVPPGAATPAAGTPTPSAGARAEQQVTEMLSRLARSAQN